MSPRLFFPAGNFLTPDDDEEPFGSDRGDLQRFIALRKLTGLEGDEVFKYIGQEFGSSYFNDFLIINDPREARKIIKESGLTATITPRERSMYRDYDLSIGDGTQVSNAEIRLKKDLEQSDGDQE